ncbi:NUDIX domain-containing protein [Candidatus Kaiserbacteria bacterium]|nr:NUDIX domain-containing protein [Candidatus Kaiserbacteria bacterium]
MNLTKQIESSLDKCPDLNTKDEYRSRLNEGNLVRDDNVHSHFCAYFVPYSSTNKTVLVGDHKKSGLWLMPGGHVDKDETLLDTLNREIKEELGVSNFFNERPEPFLMSVTNIVSNVRPCQKHFDVWHLMETDGSDFQIDYAEYNEVRWLTIPEARELVTDPANLQALDVIEKL